MKPLRTLWVGSALLVAACGRGPRLETRTFALRHLSPEEAAQIIMPYVYQDRPGAKGRTTTGTVAISAAHNVITVRETSDNLERIARVLAQYDRPQPGVRLTFAIISADGAERSDSSIRDVEATLRSLFRFKSYALVAQGIMTGTVNSGSAQMLAGAGGPYRLEAGIERISGTGDSATVTLRVHLIVPRSGGEFQTVVGIPAGKTAVLGNVLGGSPNAALILTVRPELLAN
jgi:hypothetical protein